MISLKRLLPNYRLWRSHAWNRGHQAGYRACLSHYPREQAWVERLEDYYYAHVNNCKKTKCEVCEERANG